MLGAAVVIYILSYFLIVSMFIMQTDDFKSVGFTVEGLFGWVLGNQHTDFLSYHFRRIALCYLIDYSFLLGFCIGLSFCEVTLLNSFYGTLLVFVGFVSFCYGFLNACPVLFFSTITPIKTFLSRFVIQPSHSFVPPVMKEINDTLNRQETVTVDLLGNSKLIIGPIWIILLHRHEIHFAKQRASRIVVFDSNEIIGSQGISRQFYSIRVIPSPGMSNFMFRLSHENFVFVKDKFAGPVTFANGVALGKTQRAQFIQVFKECVAENPTIRYEKPDDEQEELCFGCSVAKPNVLIRRQCQWDSRGNEENEDAITRRRIRRHFFELAGIAGVDIDARCGPCECKPMWCLDCLATWFMHRVEMHEPNIWLSCRATCPGCRAIFCLRDVLRIES